MSNRPNPQTIYGRIRRAYERGTGLRLTADDVQYLMRDTAIKDAVLETYEWEIAALDAERVAELAEDKP